MPQPLFTHPTSEKPVIGALAACRQVFEATGNVQQFIVPFWVVRPAADSSLANMKIGYQDGLPVLVNTVALENGTEPFTYKQAMKRTIEQSGDAEKPGAKTQKRLSVSGDQGKAKQEDVPPKGKAKGKGKGKGGPKSKDKGKGKAK